MYFSARGHEVHVVDNYQRRRLHEDAGTDSLIPIAANLAERTRAWREITGKTIGVGVGDLTSWPIVEDVLRGFQPETIVHYGEIPSAPFSMMDRARCIFTQTNNVVGTLNVLWAMHEITPQAHLVKLGTMGEYGTPDIDIEEGWLDVQLNGRTDRMLYPKKPGSFYHLSKVHDSHNIEFACRVWGLAATDLNQGVVYGIETAETRLDPRLATRFDYDDVWGTALNRFCVQAIIGHPLTVYGTGGQTRGYLNILDTLRRAGHPQPRRAGRVPRLQPIHRAVFHHRAGRARPARRQGGRPRGRDPAAARPAGGGGGALLPGRAHQSP
jgi:UDP-sulfoquinovose synthase